MFYICNLFVKNSFIIIIFIYIYIYISRVIAETEKSHGALGGGINADISKYLGASKKKDGNNLFQFNIQFRIMLAMIANVRKNLSKNDGDKIFMDNTPGNFSWLLFYILFWIGLFI